ncbi:glycosyltransferase family 2 protein [Paenibacillus sp. NEAU-GSW1]|uniref:glycosyltransferase family 2 protein n=1 Tax=Paenibacillus sp. NEAU-GSW1 TaxID=2682486 RepID=UPI0012E2794A|nr:glycosyltransferase family 2 protein [Paenibacillus sp. NEAU-GSW1]MUT65865.1 glycosyltransferase [Paenibacillus sp. NEAU-GSW1]
MGRKLRRVRRLKSRVVRSTSKAKGKTGSTYNAGLEAGYNEGLKTGFSCYDSLFEGTSIIIPSYNQVGYLKSCIDSISENTELPYEIIVVDNASTDGTGAYLRGLGGQVRFRVLQENYGFAGAVNMGMMMAKGTTMLILNNDTLVTDNWLENLMTCLQSSEDIGMVGPVTNYISGDQQISVPYQDVADMPEFARLNNISDPKKWHPTDRLPGFCLLFRRELWEKVGYLDEGFEIGNFEDDDFNVRVRLQGYSLVIARDSFIHHFGSVSMKALGDQFEEVNNRNMVYYMNKWGNPYEWIHHLKNGVFQGGTLHPARGEAAFYPEGVAVQGTGETIFWIENGLRRPIAGDWAGPVVRLPQVTLRRWAIGEAISSVDAHAIWQYIQDSSILAPLHGKVASGMDGFFYYIEHGAKRRIITEAAAMAWGLNARLQASLTFGQLAELPEGLPLIPPIKLRQRL